jgi:hypothetical protein
MGLGRRYTYDVKVFRSFFDCSFTTDSLKKICYFPGFMFGPFECALAGWTVLLPLFCVLYAVALFGKTVLKNYVYQRTST